MKMENSSDSQPPYQAQINSSNAGPPPDMDTNDTEISDSNAAPPPYNVMYTGHIQVSGSNDRMPVQALNFSSYGGASIICVPAPVETRPFKNYSCYVSVAIVLMSLSVLLVNPVAFMLAVGALLHVFAYCRKVSMYLFVWSGL